MRGGGGRRTGGSGLCTAAKVSAVALALLLCAAPAGGVTTSTDALPAVASAPAYLGCWAVSGLRLLSTLGSTVGSVSACAQAAAAANATTFALSGGTCRGCAGCDFSAGGSLPSCPPLGNATAAQVFTTAPLASAPAAALAAPPASLAVCGSGGNAARAASSTSPLSLACPAGMVISAVSVALVGAPAGGCGGYAPSGGCDVDVTAAAASACVGLPSCSLPATLAPANASCPSAASRSVVAQATCSSGSVLPSSCLSLLASAPSTPSGWAALSPPGAVSPVRAFCDMASDGGGYTSAPCLGCDELYSSASPSLGCAAMGMRLVIPRTQAHFASLLSFSTATVGSPTGLLAIVPGVSKPTDGLTLCTGGMGVLTSAACGSVAGAWAADDGGAFFVSSTPASQPNGDYESPCYLGLTAAPFANASGITVNDAVASPALGRPFNCYYSSGPNYICSTNDFMSGLAPPPPSPPSPSPPPPSSAVAGALSTDPAAAAAAAAAISAQLSSLSGASLASSQQGLLGSIAADAAARGGGAAAAASLVLAVLGASPSATLSVATQAAALSALGAIAGAPVDLQSGSGVASASASLTLVAASAAASNNSAAFAAVAGVQTSLLGGIAAQNASAHAPAAAAAVLAVVSSAPQVTLSGASQATALTVLGTVAGAPVDLASNGTQTVASALSAVTSSALASANAGALANVTFVVTSLGSSTAAALVASSSAGSVATTSQHIQTLVTFSPPSAAASADAITAPGAGASFQPLPASLGLTSLGVVTTFVALGFDAHPTAGAPSGVTSVARLALSHANGSSLEVDNSASPILFTLPAASVPAGSQPVCAFWSASANAYATAGCLALPSPSPAGHVLAFNASSPTPTDASLAGAWTISGPLADGCASVVIDCAAGGGGLVYPDPSRPFAVPAVGCPAAGASPAGMRLFVGSSCALNVANNSAGCWWDAAAQAFAGPSCAPPDADATSCACRHLTDFAALSSPTLSTATAGDLVAIPPGDLVTKFRLLLIVVLCLFGGMHVGAISGYHFDVATRRGTLGRLLQPAAGHRALPDGTSLWRFALEPLREDMDSPAGPAIEACAVMGIPFARIRLALPDECFGTDLSAALGRRHALSRRGMDGAAKAAAAAARKARKSRRGGGGGGGGGSAANHGAHALSALSQSSLASLVSAGVNSGYGGDCATRSGASGGYSHAWGAPPSGTPAAASSREEEEAEQEELLGTAIMLSFIQVTRLMAAPQLAHALAGAAAHFTSARTTAGRTFADTHAAMLVLHRELRTPAGWLVRARLLRLVFSQAPDGSWDASASTAFALQARHTTEVFAASHPEAAAAAKGGKPARGGGGGSGAGGGCFGGASASPADASARKSARVHHTPGYASESESDGEEFDPEAGCAADAGAACLSGGPRSLGGIEEETADCPLAGCTRAALMSCCPLSLSALDADDAPGRVWATLCAIALLEQLDISWLAGRGDLFGGSERTIVDAATSWLTAHSKARPRVAAALVDRTLAKAARRAIAGWERAWGDRVGELRRSDAIVAQRPQSHVDRTLSAAVVAVRTKHELFATFFSEPLDGLQRWQRWMVVVTCVLSSLFVNIWMFYNKSANCCSGLRALIDADGGQCPPTGPCRGFAGDCADLAATFATVPVLPGYPQGLAAWQCHAFPDTGMGGFDGPHALRDAILVGLLAIAVCLPISWFIGSAFEAANEAFVPHSWLQWRPRGWVGSFVKRNPHRGWHYDRDLEEEGEPPSRFARWHIRCGRDLWLKTAVSAAAALAAAAGVAEAWWAVEERAAREEGEPEGTDEAVEPAGPRRGWGGYTAAGFLALYAVWALLTWFIFAYAELIYRLLGASTQTAFARSFGISYGMVNVAQGARLFIDVLEAGVFVVLLEKLYLSRNTSWIESHIDYLSVSALFYNDSDSWFKRANTHYAFSKRLQ